MYANFFIRKKLCGDTSVFYPFFSFQKGDIIDIIAKHKTGIWVGMAQGKVGHFKFINVEEMDEERKTKHRRRKINNEWNKKPETLEELLKQLDLQVIYDLYILMYFFKI